MWFRVELNKDGSVAACQVAEATQRENGRRVYYIDAENQAAAIRAAAARHQQYLARQREQMAARRSERNAAGLCRDCQQPFTPDGQRTIRCEGCAQRNTDLRHNGAKPGVRGVPRAGVIAARAQDVAFVAAGAKLILYRKVLAAFEAKTAAEFKVWLLREIDKCEAQTPGKVAAAE